MRESPEQSSAEEESPREWRTEGGMDMPRQVDVAARTYAFVNARPEVEHVASAVLALLALNTCDARLVRSPGLVAAGLALLVDCGPDVNGILVHAEKEKEGWNQCEVRTEGHKGQQSPDGARAHGRRRQRQSSDAHREVLTSRSVRPKVV